MEDKVKRLAEMKSYLEKKIRELEDEIGLLREMLALIDQQLARDSFKPASQLLREKTEKTVTPVQVERESNIHSRKIGGKVIGKLVY
ncbi:MAG: hypothetical protein J7L38_00300, partial [Thermoproteales archaeon]|nr:hypothetical protein [Thermoproteales archaeon]